MENKVILNVEGMTCSNCALTITKVLEKEGLKEVNTNFATGEVMFDEVPDQLVKQAVRNINSLGYHVVETAHPGSGIATEGHGLTHANPSFSIEKKFYWCLLFTVPLMLHMVLPFHFLHMGIVQLLLCLPVVIIGMQHFGKSAWASVRTGVPNMDVLIVIGSGSAFIYSLAGMILYDGQPEAGHYLFFETAAAIFTLVLL